MMKKVPMITWGSNFEVLELINRLDWSLLPYKLKIDAGFAEKGEFRNMLSVHVNIHVKDSHNKKKKIWVGATTRAFLPMNKQGKVSGREILALVRKSVHNLIMHEIDESFFFDDELAWDPHTAKGRARRKTSF